MDKIFMKLGWPGALVLLVGFLSLAIYIVVNRAIVENEQIEKASTSEQSTADTSDIEVSKNNNQDQGSSETESVAMNKEDATLIVKQSSLEDKVSEEKLANAQDLKKKSDLITPNENDTPKRGVETNETNQKLTQDDKSITNLEEIKELNNAEVMKTEEGLLQGSTEGGSK